MPEGNSKPLIEALPTPAQVRNRLTDAMREVALLKQLLRVSESADRYKACDRLAKHGQAGGDNAA